MTDFEVHLSLEGGTRQIGRARSNRVRGKETVIFEYTDEWLSDTNRFELEPGLPLTRGGFAPPTGQNIHGALQAFFRNAEVLLGPETSRSMSTGMLAFPRGWGA